MIVASHQPNFLPYPGYFLKMYLANCFTLSNTVQYSSSNYHNYNYFVEIGTKRKVTVPVSKKREHINEVALAEWPKFSVKLIKRIRQDYSKAPCFDKVFPGIEAILKADHKLLIDLNLVLLHFIHDQFCFESQLILESTLDIQGASPSEQIVDICKKTGADTYLSGDGAHEYLNEDMLRRNGINLFYASYVPIQYGSIENASILDYIMKVGYRIPDEWKRRKDSIHEAANL